MKTVLFLCTANYYRSRFAEILFNWHATQTELAWRADSRGLALFSDDLGHLSQDTVDRLVRMEIPLDGYRRYPKDLNLSDLEAAHHVVAVKGTEHHPLVSKRFPEWLDKIEFWEVHDIDCARPEDALSHLEKEVMGLLQRLHYASVEGK